jgi:hypothetical protein
MTQATSSGTSDGIFTAPFACVTTFSANAATFTPRYTVWSPIDRPVEPSGKVFEVIPDASTQSDASPRTQK